MASPTASPMDKAHLATLIAVVVRPEYDKEGVVTRAWLPAAVPSDSVDVDGADLRFTKVDLNLDNMLGVRLVDHAESDCLCMRGWCSADENESSACTGNNSTPGTCLAMPLQLFRSSSSSESHARRCRGTTNFAAL